MSFLLVNARPILDKTNDLKEAKIQTRTFRLGERSVYQVSGYYQTSASFHTDEKDQKKQNVKKGHKETETVSFILWPMQMTQVKSIQVSW